MKRIQLTFIACSLALSGAAWAQSSADSSYLKRTTPRFETFAGSSTNLTSLASGLRSGTPITLTGNGQTANFTSPTRPMGYGNITRSLDLAQRQLALQGITNPTPNQLQAALTGGTVTGPKGTVNYAGVLQMRSDGMGWGKIAQTVGVHPGMGKSASAAVPAARASATNASGRSVTAHGNDKATSARASGNGNGHARITTPSGNSGNSAAAAHANARGLGNSAATTSAAGAHAGGGGNHGIGGGGGNHGNAGGGGGGRGK